MFPLSKWRIEVVCGVTEVIILTEITRTHHTALNIQCPSFIILHAKFNGKKMSCLVFTTNTTCNLKNHWTKHRHACTNLDAFSMLISNMITKFNISEIFKKVLKNLLSSVFESSPLSVNYYQDTAFSHAFILWAVMIKTSR